MPSYFYTIPKPYPDMYELAAQNLGLLPSECIVVEDVVTGITAAREVGIGKIYALGPKNKHEYLRSIPGVCEVINNLYEIPVSIFDCRDRL